MTEIPEKTAKRRPELTPEYIAEQRALREARKKAKLEEKERLGLPTGDPNDTFDTSFLKRPMLRIPAENNLDSVNGQELKIMTYNALAQCLIRRSLFPENGKAVLKWKNRSRALINEIQHYDPDVLCMQEVDKDKIEEFWTPQLKDKLGLETVFRTFEGKPHGQIIAYRKGIFQLESEKVVVYDNEETPGATKQIESRNTGMLLALRFIKDDHKKHGIVIGTSHMFWHPMGSYERTRQLAVFTQKAVEFGGEHNSNEWPIFLAGDYNSECFDTPYLCASHKPVSLDKDALDILRASARHEFKKATAEEEDEAAQGQTGGDDTLLSEEMANSRIDALIGHFNSVKHNAVSLYRQYKKVHPANIHPKGQGEPFFSNWAHKWRGLLDYIFVMQPVDADDEAVSEFASGPVRLLELLRMPEPHEMGPEPCGQPREGQYPSDHLCMMAKVKVVFSAE